MVPTPHWGIAVMICSDLEFAEQTRRVNWPLFPRPTGERSGEVINAMAIARAPTRSPSPAGTDPFGWVAAAVGPGEGVAG